MVRPSSSSNSTEEPITSRMRGSTETRRPAALAMRTTSSTGPDSVPAGARMTLWTPLRSTIRSNSAAVLSSGGLRPSINGIVATTSART